MAADQHHNKEKIEARPKNWLMSVALVILQNECSYGYRLIERSQEFGFESVNPGTFYRTLRQLEHQGLCRSEWDEDSVGVRPRRMYSITDAGEEYLAAWAEQGESYQEVMDSFFRAYNEDLSS